MLKIQVVSSFFPSRPRTTDILLSPFFSLKSRFLGLGRKILGHLGIFGQTVSIHFGTVSPLSMFSIIQSIFIKTTTKSLYPHSNQDFLNGPVKDCVSPIHKMQL